MSPERWEHRAWPSAEAVSAAADVLRREGRALGSAYRTDVYLLGEETGLLVKLRGGERYEEKRRGEARDGLERWTLTTSEGFPLPAGRASLLPEAPSAAFALPAALLAHARALETLLVLPVRKHRERFALGEAEAEVTGVLAEGRDATVTVGVEAEGLDAAREAARRLGTLDLPNRDYGAWLRG